MYFGKDSFLMSDVGFTISEFLFFTFDLT